jgi:hypothetical protein
MWLFDIDTSREAIMAGQLHFCGIFSFLVAAFICLFFMKSHDQPRKGRDDERR